MKERRVKIVCTLGPACRDGATLREMIRAGMDVARLNFSHGDHAEHAGAIRKVRDLSRDLDRPVALLADLCGPKIRIGSLPDGPRRLRKGETVVLSTHLEPPDPGAIGTTYPRLAADVRPGNMLLLDDGRLRLEVLRCRSDRVEARVLEGGELRAHKGINLPGVSLSTPALTARDRADLAFAVRRGVDLVALSFVRRAADVRAAVRLLRRLSGTGRPPAGRPPFAAPHPPLVAKLEKPQALEDLDAILAASGGVMVARGDLGVEIPPEQVPLAQKRIIREALELGRPVITATQMLESMTESPRPTRAEASDVANAVLDGTDAVMLSGETAAGRYPVEAVRMMDRIVRAAEAGPAPAGWLVEGSPDPSREAVSRAAVSLAEALGAPAIVALTGSGATALRLSRLRPSMPILALSTNEGVVRRLGLVWGVTAGFLRQAKRLRPLVRGVDQALRERRMARAGQRVVLVMGYPLGDMGRTNLVKVHVVGETT